MLAVKRVKLPASGWLNRQDKPLHQRGMFPVEICEIHSLGRYSREVLNRSTARASGVFRDEKRVRHSSAYRTTEMDTRKREGNRRSTKCGNGSCSRLIAVTANSSLINC